MVSNATFAGMVEEMQSQAEISQDYLVPSGQARMEGDKLLAFNDDAFQLKEIAHQQLATKLKIPNQFYKRMWEYPGLRSDVVNRLLEKDERTSLVRTLGGEVRAVLSDRYKPISNLDVLNASAPVLRDMEVEIKSSSYTESKMYMQVAFPRLEAEITVGDAVQYGLTITNSEVGMGMVKVSPTIWRLICENGMIKAAEIKHRHIGKQMEMGEDYTIFTDEAKIADATAFRLKLRDTIQSSVSEAAFAQWVGLMKGAVEDKIEDVVKTIDNVTSSFNLDESLKDLMVNNLASEGNLNRWGVANAVTALCHNTENRDLQYEVEQIGSKIIDMTPAQWGRMAS